MLDDSDMYIDNYRVRGDLGFFVKQKTAYEIQYGLVGSEMCIRDSDYVREHNEALSTLDFVPVKEEITTAYDHTKVKMVEMHDGSMIRLHKISPEWDPEDKLSIITALHKARTKQEILTGLLYVDNKSVELNDLLNTTNTPLNQLTEIDLNPGSENLEKICASYR